MNVASDPLDAAVIHFTMEAQRNAVPEARHAILAACLRAGLREEDTIGLDLAVGEALANAVVHGMKDGAVPGHDAVEISLWSYHGNLILQVSNHGAAFHPPPPPYAMPAASDNETHGRGLPLMEMLTDAMVVCDNDIQEGGSSTFLVKHIPNTTCRPA